MDTIGDVVKKSVEQSFVNHNLDREKFSEDITCYNETGTKCAVVLDNMDSMDKQFVIIGLQPNLDGEWLETGFVHSSNVDGIDAMSQADSFLS